jgi:hypothetical protein
VEPVAFSIERVGLWQDEEVWCSWTLGPDPQGVYRFAHVFPAGGKYRLKVAMDQAAGGAVTAGYVVSVGPASVRGRAAWALGLFTFTVGGTIVSVWVARQFGVGRRRDKGTF